ncbi:MAG: DUF262 domain-containing protein [Bacteroidota bacterium]
MQSSRAQDRDLATWFSKIEQGEIKLPRFQRHQAWDRQRISSLIETVVSNLPLGVTLILNVGEEEPFESRFLATAPESGQKVYEHLLDGQQRLTAFWRSMHNNYESETYFLYLPEYDRRPGDSIESDSMMVYCLSRYRKKNESKLYPLWANNPESQFERGLIPVYLFRPGSNGKEKDNWVEMALPDEDYNDNNGLVGLESYKMLVNKRKELSDKITKFKEIVAHYNLPYLALPSSTPREIALKVFINMNTNSKPLSVYDIIVAQVESVAGKSLHDLQEELRIKHRNIENYFDLGQLIIYTSALIQDKIPNNKGCLEMDKKIMMDHWSDVVIGLCRMAGFLESQNLFDRSRLPTNAVLAIIAALYAEIPESGDSLGHSERLLRKYLWSSFFTDRYENSAASRGFADYVGLKKIIRKEKKDGGGVFNESEIPIFNRERHPIAEKAELLTAFWPKGETIRGRAILSVFNLLGAHDFKDGQKITRENIRTRDYHHFYPVSLLSEIDRKGMLALNCCLVSSFTNRSIGRKNPYQVITEQYNSHPPENIDYYLRSHLIPLTSLEKKSFEGIDAMVLKNELEKDYESFLNGRAELVEIAANLLCEGQIISIERVYHEMPISKSIQNLEHRVKDLELKLRHLISERLGRVAKDPFRQFVDEKTQEAARRKFYAEYKKMPALSEEEFKVFRNQLNYMTLGEYQSVICNKKTWTYFEEVFKSKPFFQKYFNQLTTLRNKIAHPNEIDEVILKDGEAAIHWFENALS